MSANRDCLLLIPGNLDIDSLIPEDVSGEARKKFFDRTIYLIHVIISRLNTKKVFDQYLDKGYVRLMKKYLRQIMGTQTSLVTENLIHRNVIARDPNYKIGEYSMGYILTSKYIDAAPEKVKLRSYEVMKIYRNKQEEQRKLQQKLSMRIRHVIGQLDREWSVDIKGAFKWIERFEENFYSKIRSSKNIPDTKKNEVIGKYTQYYKYARRELQRIDNGVAGDYIIDEKGGRLHTVYTRLPRPLKNYLQFNDESLVSIDLKNSQPFLLGCMVQKHFFDTNNQKVSRGNDAGELRLHRIWKKMHDKIMKDEKKKNERNAIIRMLKISETLASSDIAPINFSNITTSGKFYEHIMSVFGNLYYTSGIDRFATRNATKQEVMRLMYFDTRKANVEFYAPFKKFEELFPFETRIMRLIKSCGFKDFSILLQKMESKLMLEKVGEKLPKEIPFLTVHDSLILPEKYVDEAITKINFAFDFYLKRIPKVSEPEFLTPEKGMEDLEPYAVEKLTNIEIKFSGKGNLTAEDIMIGDGLVEE